ncbi:MAG: cell division protein ZapA [Pyrinomonadaceae bacterium]|nr:cell division protein ZapA [Pyrinomonadaceae bacterium]MDQ3257780.1 cell division protein ZapA [Acidobacteriota bacterium]
MGEEQRDAVPAVSVVIFNQLFNLRSEQGGEYIGRVASLVDARMREVSRIVPSGDVIKIAVLAALNIADELCRLRQLSGVLEERAGARDAEQRPPAPEAVHQTTPEAAAMDDSAAGPPAWSYEDIFEAAPEKNGDQQRMTQQFSNRLRSLRQQSGQEDRLTIPPEGG